MNMTIGELGLLAGAIMSTAGLIVFLVKPVFKLNESINKLNLTLEILSRDLEASKEDRKSIHVQLDRQDDRIDSHELKIAEHSQQIKTLFEKGK